MYRIKEIRLSFLKWFMKLFLTQNEKCFLTQAINEQREVIIKEHRTGLVSYSDFKTDMDEIDFFRDCFKNELWK